MDNLNQRLQVLEETVHELHKEVLRLRAKKGTNADTSLQGFVQYQSIEAFHPCLDKYNLCPKVDNPNNTMCFTPTTYAMFTGTCSRPPLLAIREVKTHPDPEVVDVLGTAERRYRVDLAVEFHSVDVEELFTGNFKDGSEKMGPLEYETFVHVDNPTEFVGFLMKRYNKTISCWNSLASLA